MFERESVQPVRLPTSKTHIQVYKLSNSDFRIVFVDIPGPLVSCSIVIPTTSKDHKGLPHTLEHLVFCGSESIPHRGYLDNLATRCLSTGTNAYTAEDHTCYEITTAGAEGMMNVFPIFLDHILNPTLKPSQFMTEVYHVDHHGKQQGVVYCEMASRENTEPDLLDLNLRQMVYDMETTYSCEAGGLTKDIQHLTNDEIIEYHKMFYHLNNTTAIVCGPVNIDEFLTRLGKHEKLLLPKKVEMPVISVHPPPLVEKGLISKTVPFPSEEEDVGSIAYGWRGPPSEDFRTILALEVLFRYFNDNPSSLFPQVFVERRDPYATDVDFDLKAFVDTSIFLIFSGVPYKTTGVDQAEDEEMSEDSGDDEVDSDEDMDGDSQVDSDGSVAESRDDLFETGVYFGLVHQTILDFVNNGFKENNMLNTLKRHRQKILEELEDSPHESITGLLVSDVTRYYLASKSSLKDTRTQSGTPYFGGRLQVFDLLDSFETEPEKFWIDLARKYLLENPVREVMMVPDSSLAKRLNEQQVFVINKINEEKKRLSDMSDTQRRRVEQEVMDAVKENEVDLPHSVLHNMPPIPDVSKTTSIRHEMHNFNLDEGFDSKLFQAAQVIKTETAFYHFGCAFYIGNLPKELRNYLVLFQELLFQSSLCVPGLNEPLRMDYREVSKYVSQVFVSHECGVGLGNSIFSVSYLCQMFTMFITCNPSDWSSAVRFLSQVLLFSEFENHRIITVAKNLLSNIVDIKRDGNSIMAAVSNRVICDPKYTKLLGNNETAISIFEQEGFLKEVVALCQQDSKEVIKKLNKLRNEILKNTDGLNFMRIAIPFNTGLKSHSGFRDVMLDTIRVWNGELDGFHTGKEKKKRKAKSNEMPFPFPRIPFSLEHYDQRFSKSLLVPVGGLTTCFLTQFVPCDLLKTPRDPDYFPTVLLAEILSRTEGLLYTGIRGKGYAYGAYLNCFLWAGQLSFELYRTSEPKLALECFYEILSDLGTDVGLQRICSDYEIQTAQASIAYRWASNESTSSTVISNALRSSLQGFKDLNEHKLFIQELYKVTRTDLKRCFEKYFKLFLTSGSRVTVLTTPTGDSAESIQASFKTIKDFNGGGGIDFPIYSLKDLNV